MVIKTVTGVHIIEHQDLFSVFVFWINEHRHSDANTHSKILKKYMYIYKIFFVLSLECLPAWLVSSHKYDEDHFSKTIWKFLFLCSSIKN